MIRTRQPRFSSPARAWPPFALCALLAGGCADRSLRLPDPTSAPLAAPDLAALDLATTRDLGSIGDLLAPPDPTHLPIIQLSAGGGMTCAVVDGAAKCWGDNGSGQLGNGSTTDSFVPVGVRGLSSGVASISASANYACALTRGGAVKCWGDNSFGSLGNGSPTSSSVPVDVSGLASDVVAISTGSVHACALTRVGAVKCWGYNRNGQLGDGTATNRAIPVDVSGLSSNVAAISAGDSHCCALLATGAVKCWGHNGVGELGNGSTVDSSVPVDVTGLSSGAVALSQKGSYQTCAITSAGTAKCWGWNYFGQLGRPAPAWTQTVPVEIVGLSSHAVAIVTGYWHSCALTSAGAVECWGENRYGQLGNGAITPSPSYAPVGVIGLSAGVVALSAGYFQVCAATSAGAVRCWGRNLDGELGNGSTAGSPVPVDVKGL
jgi:alpha-tubulin suppressor-like RCC1 family protein